MAEGGCGQWPPLDWLRTTLGHWGWSRATHGGQPHWLGVAQPPLPFLFFFNNNNNNKFIYFAF
jgi:hypothetical protein